MPGMTNARMYIGGVEVPVSNFSYERSMVDEVVHDLRPEIYSVTTTMTLRGEDADALLDLFRPVIRGATDATLAKRMHYGGRKGRSAWRRLRAKGFVGTLVVNDFPPIPLPPFRLLTTPDKHRKGI